MRSPISRPSSLLRLVPSLLAAVLLLLTSCGGEVGVLLDIGAWPAQAETLRIRGTFNGVAGQEQIIYREQTRFVVYVPTGSVGSLVLEIVALDAQSCKVAADELDREIGAWFPPVREHAVTLAAIMPAACTLTVHTPGGTVAVDGSEVLCPASDTPCEVDRPLGSTVTLTATADAAAPDSVPFWTEGCTAYGRSCTFQIDGNRSVSLKWEPRLCSPDGWCWKNPIQGFSPSQIAFDPSGEVWLAGSGSFVLRCRDKDCRQLSGSLSTGSFTSISAGKDELWGIRNGLLYRCAQQSCAEVPTGQPYELRSVAASPTGEVWAVGRAETIVRCVGGVCASTRTNNTGKYLNKVAVNRYGHMWAAGTQSSLFRCLPHGNCVSLSHLGKVNWINVSVLDNGYAWLQTDSNQIVLCDGVYSMSQTIPTADSLLFGKDSDLWAVSDSPLQAFHCTSSGCTEVPITAASSDGSALTESADAVWGSRTPTASSVPLVRCSAAGCVSFSTNLDGLVRTVATSPTSEVWAIDEGGALLRCRGSRCFTTSPGPGYTTNITGIGAYGQDSWAAADRRLLRCTGTDCRSAATGLDTTESFDFQVTHIASGNELWVGGSYISTSSGSALPGVIVRFRCRASVCTALPRFMSFVVMDLSARGQIVWVAGIDGQLLRCSELGCSTRYQGTKYSLLAISADEDGFVWAVGASSTIVLCNSASCESVASGTTSILGAVSASRLLTLVAASPGYLACTGSTCTMVSVPVKPNSVSVNGQGEGWLVSNGGWVNYCKGTTCSTIPSGTTKNLSRVRADNLGGAWVVGDGGTLLYCTNSMCTSKDSGTFENLSGIDIGQGSIWVSGTAGAILQHAL